MKSVSLWQIYEFNGEPRGIKGPYQGRILWSGSKDLQDVSITIVNVTLNDSGLYRCTIKRYFNYKIHRPSVTDVKDVQLTVHEDGEEIKFCVLRIAEFSSQHWRLILFNLWKAPTFWTLLMDKGFVEYSTNL